MMNSGWNTTAALNVSARRAVIQCWKTCGNIPTDNGINKYVMNFVRLISDRVAWESGIASPSTRRFAKKLDSPPNRFAIT